MITCHGSKNVNDDNDFLDGGPEDDFLSGGPAPGIITFGPGSGPETIDAKDGLTGICDVLRLPGLTPGEVEFLPVRNGPGRYDLIIRIKATGDALTICNAICIFHDCNCYGFQIMEFGDGTVMDWEDFNKLDLTGANDVDHSPVIMDDGNGDDILYGGSDDDPPIVIRRR